MQVNVIVSYNYLLVLNMDYRSLTLKTTTAGLKPNHQIKCLAHKPLYNGVCLINNRFFSFHKVKELLSKTNPQSAAYSLGNDLNPMPLKKTSVCTITSWKEQAPAPSLKT